MATELKHTVAPSGGDFTTLQGAIAHLIASHANFVTADVYGTVEISGSWSSPDTTAVVISGLTTNATHYLYIYATGAARHAGVWSDSKYNLSVAGDGITVYDDFVWVDGIQLAQTHATVEHYCVNADAQAAGSWLWFSNLILKGRGGSTYNEAGYYLQSANATVYIWNNILYNWATTAAAGVSAIYALAGTTYVYKTTAIGGYRTVANDGTGVMVCKNTYAGQGAGACFYNGGTSQALTNCASSDTSAGSSNGCKSSIVYSTTEDSTHAGFVNVTAGTENLHIKGGANALKDAGVDTHGESAPLNFTTDIDGVAISGSWDIGADEYGTAANLATVTTASISSIYSTLAAGGGNVTDDGGASVTAKGVCWSTSANPTTANSKTSDGSGTGSFTSSITGLSPGTVYHVRAYATNSVGTSYGSDVQFTSGNPIAKVIDE